MIRASITIIFLLFGFYSQKYLVAQNFVLVTDQTNPIVNPGIEDYWTGCTWVDYDNDYDLDLFIVNRIPGTTPRKNKLFRNDGNGIFTRITSDIIADDNGYWFGISWADFDNDGDLDCHVAGFPSTLYQNDGDGTFTKITTGEIAAFNLGGIGNAWGDYDSDGDIDLIIVWPEWMQGVPSMGGPKPPHFFHNDGPPNYTFTKIITGAIQNGGIDTYLQPSWYDFDEDDDLDLFIGTGSGTPLPDKMYKNLLSEIQIAEFEPLTNQPFSVDSIEGQHWNWIDIDNDLDLDVFVTSWGTTMPAFHSEENSLWLNDNGSFVKVTQGEIVTDTLPTVTNMWGDYDNDGDLDLIVTTDEPYPLAHYKNNGNGSFTKETSGELVNTIRHQSCATSGDYDNDGDLDIYISGKQSNTTFFRNDMPATNGWIKLKLKGNTSNASGIGSKIFLKANINGNAVWQRRDVTTGNTFFGHNSLEVHFGLGDANLIDSLLIKWPSGIIDAHTDVSINNFYVAEEEQSITIITNIDHTENNLPKLFELKNNYPNPFNPETTIEYQIPTSSNIQLKVYDVLGNELVTLLDEYRKPGSYKVKFNAKGLSSGIYFYKLQAENFVSSKKMILIK